MFISLALYSIGFAGFILNSKYILLALLSIELMLLGSNISRDITGTAISFYTIVIAGAKSAIGLALVVSYHKNRGNSLAL